jgi:hypothetical protein
MSTGNVLQALRRLDGFKLVQWHQFLVHQHRVVLGSSSRWISWHSVLHTPLNLQQLALPASRSAADLELKTLIMAPGACQAGTVWLAANPSKRWAEVFFLAYSPFWIAWALCILVPFQLHEVGWLAQTLCYVGQSAVVCVVWQIGPAVQQQHVME